MQIQVIQPLDAAGNAPIKADMHLCHPMGKDPIRGCWSQLPPTQPLICCAVSQLANQKPVPLVSWKVWVAYLRQQLLAVHFLHGMAIQGKLVAAVAKGPSFCVLFHGPDTSRRNAFQSSAEVCQMQLIGPKGAPVKRQYSMPVPLG